MIFKVPFGFLHFLFLTLTTEAMPETFARETTDLPDDQKELKEMDPSRGVAHGFPSHMPYQSGIFNFQRAPAEFTDFSYHLDQPGNTGSAWDSDAERALDVHGSDVYPANGDVSKRGNRQFKQGHQKFRFDPALNRLGLGKRDSSDRPKYNPGWKFIGLGKRIIPFSQSMNPSAFHVDQLERKEFKESSPDTLIPYYRILAMHDVSMFLDDIEDHLQGNPRRTNRSQTLLPDHAHFGLYNPTGNEETSPKVKHSSTGFLVVGSQKGYPERSNKPQLFFTRSRKPTSMYRNNKSKPMYDPGWLMTGLGK